MTSVTEPLDRLPLLAETVRLEASHLQATDARLFAASFTTERVAGLANDIELAERVDAFVSRFGRLQDTLADKLLPELLRRLAEPVRSAVENLDRAEKLGFIEDVERWLQARRLRNQMVHEYQRDPSALAQALNAGHDHVQMLLEGARRMTDRAQSLGRGGDRAPMASR